jgi:hypothetical protein
VLLCCLGDSLCFMCHMCLSTRMTGADGLRGILCVSCVTYVLSARRNGAGGLHVGYCVFHGQIHGLQ